MKIRIIGNSGSGKTTVARSLSMYYDIYPLHLDSIAFVPNSDFILRERVLVQDEIRAYIARSSKWIIEGNYITTIADVYNNPDLVIFIDLPVEQSLYNFEQRFKQYEGKSRPEHPNLVETDKQAMIDWITDFPKRREELTNYIVQEQMQNPLVNILHLEDMGEVIALCNNPDLIEGFYS